MTTITVATIRHNPKLSKITTPEGDEFAFWSDKADKLGLEEGRSYNIEVNHWEGKDGRTVPVIVKTKRVTLGAQQRASADPVPFQSGAYRPPAGSALATPTQANSSFYRPTHPRDAQRMFVTKLLGDALTAKAVPFDLPNMTAAANVLMEVWRRTIGREEMPFEEAAE
jgi:hypothetical protein